MVYGTYGGEERCLWFLRGKPEEKRPKMNLLSQAYIVNKHRNAYRDHLED
jgi:hypothetical protein